MVWTFAPAPFGVLRKILPVETDSFWKWLNSFIYKQSVFLTSVTCAVINGNQRFEWILNGFIRRYWFIATKLKNSMAAWLEIQSIGTLLFSLFLCQKNGWIFFLLFANGKLLHFFPYPMLPVDRTLGKCRRVKSMANFPSDWLKTAKRNKKKWRNKGRNRKIQSSLRRPKWFDLTTLLQFPRISNRSIRTVILKSQLACLEWGDLAMLLQCD